MLWTLSFKEKFDFKEVEVKCQGKPIREHLKLDKILKSTTLNFQYAVKRHRHTCVAVFDTSVPNLSIISYVIRPLKQIYKRDTESK